MEILLGLFCQATLKIVLLNVVSAQSACISTGYGVVFLSVTKH